MPAQLGMRTSNDIELWRYPHQGFATGDEPGEKLHFAFWWGKSESPPDWQVSLRNRELAIANSDSVILQRTGTDAMKLDIGCWFRNRNDFTIFLAMSRLSGTLWRLRRFTMHEPDEERSRAEGVYALFNDVNITKISNQSFDNDGGVRCRVTFTRAVNMPTYYGFGTYAEDE
jgi:hypothetical protein